jgi:chaperonin GroES
MSVKRLKEISRSVNIASELDEDLLCKIGQDVLSGFDEDMQSNQEWLSDIKRIEELASLKSVKKSYPLPNSANVKLPLITKACYEFASRIHPEIVRDNKVVKPRIIGKTKDKFKEQMAFRVCDFMNYQLLLKNSDWQEQLIKLLVRLALIGFICKKTWYDPIRKGIKQVICKPDELIIHADSPSLKEATRISHVIHWRLNDLVEHTNTTEDETPIFLEKPVKELVEMYKDDNLNRNIDGIEQCTYLDLDEDGYKEPYIVTVVKNSGKVLRIVAQFDEDDIFTEGKDEVCYVNREEYYEDFHFLPSPKGNFQSVGFGILLLHLNESANSIMNQLLDAGQLANLKGGYMDARLKSISGGNSLHDAGEFKLVKVMSGASLKDGILPIQYSEPSSVLYTLLGLIIDVSRDLTSSAQINNGTQSSENAKTGATLALQAEGKKVSNSINISLYTSITKEFKHIFDLNEHHLTQEEYMDVLDDPMANVKKDFDDSKVNIMPIADPNLSSDTQRLAEAGVIQQLMGLPGVDPLKATKLILSRVAIPDIESILVDENAPTPPPIELLKLQSELEGHSQELRQKDEELEIKRQDQIIKVALAKAQIKQMEATALNLIAKAESEDIKVQLQEYQAYLDTISKSIDSELVLKQMNNDRESKAQEMGVMPNDQENGLGGMVSEPGNPESDIPPQ